MLKSSILQNMDSSVVSSLVSSLPNHHSNDSLKIFMSNTEMYKYFVYSNVVLN